MSDDRMEFFCPLCKLKTVLDITEYTSKIASLQATLDAHAESEASVCPEDVGCVEYIKVLQAKLEAAHADVRALAEDLQMAQGQWGDDYLWKKWELSESLSRPTVRKIVEGT